jgi:hypothetical protein
MMPRQFSTGVPILSSAAGSKPSRLTLSGEIEVRKKAIDSRPSPSERRAKPRISQPFPTNTWGVDVRGQTFEIEADLENMSSTGLYLRVSRQMKLGDELNVRIKFSNGIKTGATALLLGRVLRVEPGVDGLNGIALAIKQYEFV